MCVTLARVCNPMLESVKGRLGLANSFWTTTLIAILHEDHMDRPKQGPIKPSLYEFYLNIFYKRRAEATEQSTNTVNTSHKPRLW